MTHDICQLNIDELRALLLEMGEKKFRADQIYTWLHKHKAKSFEEMNNIPAALKAKLQEAGYGITVMDAEDVLISKIDGTRKYIFALEDGHVIEAVLMKYKHGNSVCISSQVGCRMGCRFCASTLDGCARDLTSAEMLAEVYRIEKDCGERVSNIVIMGSGEPLENYGNVMKFLRMVTAENGLNISARNITLSTCGLVPQIYQLAEEKLPITLALSLHAPTQEKRQEIMPIAYKYHIDEVLKACAAYYKKSGRRLSFEYSVVKGVNDSKEEALTLVNLLKGFEKMTGMRGRGNAQKTGGRDGAFHVNIIPVNPIEERDYESPDKAAVSRFRDILEQNGINATIRREMGRDISSACGQLRRRYAKHADTGTN